MILAFADTQFAILRPMKILLSLLLLTLGVAAQPTHFAARVIGVSDGDTYRILVDNREIKVRLDHVDCPERGQPFGKAAKQFGADFCFGKDVTVKTHGKRDRYRRLIAEIYIGKMCLNKELVRHGLAWHFTRYSKNREYAELHARARISRTGLWREPNALPPWEWRKNRKVPARKQAY